MNILSLKQSFHEKISEKEGFIFRPRWFLITRFIAVAGVAVTLVVSRFGFQIETIHYPALWMLTGVLFLCNILYLLYYHFFCNLNARNARNLKHHLGLFTMLQINGDLAILTLMLHFSGGATNPFIFYYFFHTILASILLSKKAAYTQACVAAVMFSTMTILEGTGIIRHYILIDAEYYAMYTFIAGMCFALTSALFIAVYMATSIMERLRLQQAELVRALSETERLEIEKSHFLDVVAHDLKSPLASIETLVTSTLSVYGDELPPKVTEVLKRIPHRTEKLLSFIQELLDFSKIRNIDKVQVPFKPLNFLPIVTSTVEMHISEAIEKHITITLNSDPDIPTIMGNKTHLEHMVSNLISNAVRYTPENGSVTVKITADHSNVILTVADTGIGIPDDELSCIFDDFYRARNARSANASGTGLGLSISKSIVEKHGGTMSVASTLGEGTVFTVRLPRADS